MGAPLIGSHHSACAQSLNHSTPGKHKSDSCYQVSSKMVNNTLFRFTVRLSLESSPCTPRPDCIGYTQSGEESSLRFPAGKAGSVDDVLSLPNRVVAEGCGQLELCLGAANVEWLLSELEHNIVEKMCQVSREGINSLTAGGGKCSG